MYIHTPINILTDKCRHISLCQYVLGGEVGQRRHNCTEYPFSCIHWRSERGALRSAAAVIESLIRSHHECTYTLHFTNVQSRYSNQVYIPKSIIATHHHSLTLGISVIIPIQSESISSLYSNYSLYKCMEFR